MAKKITNVLGVDIGSQMIKVAEVRSQGGQPTISAAGMIATPEGAVDHTGVYDSDAVGAAIKQLCGEIGASAPQAVVSVAGQASVLVRTVEVPKMSDDELKEHMQWEINRNIPFSESTVESDYQAIPPTDPGATNMDVVMAIAPRSAVDTLVACMRKAGKSAAALDVEPLSLGRDLVQSMGDVLGDETVCVVDFGHKSMSINIYRDGNLVLPRTVPVGSELFTQAIADALQISVNDADALKREKGMIPESVNPVVMGGSAGPTSEFQAYNPFADEPASAEPAAIEPVAEVSTGDPQSDAIYRAIAPAVEEVVAEIRRSIDFYRSKGGDVQRILMCGGGSELKGLRLYLSKALGLNCDVLDPTRRLNVNLRKPQVPLEQHAGEFAVAIGNGLYIFF